MICGALLDNRVGSACLFASAACVCDEAVAPKVLLYHSFDRGLEKADFSAAAVKDSVDGEVTRRDDGVRGRAAQFAKTAPAGRVKIDVAPLDLGPSGTPARWNSSIRPSR